MSNKLEMKYFVLKPAGSDVFAKASRKAMRAYAWMLKGDDADNGTTENTEFADGILAWVDREYAAYLEAAESPINDEDAP